MNRYFTRKQIFWKMQCYNVHLLPRASEKRGKLHLHTYITKIVKVISDLLLMLLYCYKQLPAWNAPPSSAQYWRKKHCTSVDFWATHYLYESRFAQSFPARTICLIFHAVFEVFPDHPDKTSAAAAASATKAAEEGGVSVTSTMSHLMGSRNHATLTLKYAKCEISGKRIYALAWQVLIPT